MKPIFVDTSALIALGNARDQFHHQATRLFKAYMLANRRFVTTNAVIFELTNAFSAAQYKSLAIRLFDLIYGSKAWTVVIVDQPLMEKGMEKFKQVQDKDWSLVDCMSMIIAREAAITEIFTNDHHFEQAGLTITLK
jgi:predicted nucleic acid-binding protein